MMRVLGYLEQGHDAKSIATFTNLTEGTIYTYKRELREMGYTIKRARRQTFTPTREMKWEIRRLLRTNTSYKAIAEKMETTPNAILGWLKRCEDPQVVKALEEKKRMVRVKREPKPIKKIDATHQKLEEWAESQGKTIKEINAANRHWMIKNGYFIKTPKGTNSFQITVKSKNRKFDPPASWLSEWQKS